MKERKIFTRKFLTLIIFLEYLSYVLLLLARAVMKPKLLLSIKKNNPLISMTDLLFHFITIYYNLPNITRSLRVSIFHCLECFFSVCSSCFNIPYNVSFTHLQTFSTTLAMKSKIENRYFLSLIHSC